MATSIVQVAYGIVVRTSTTEAASSVKMKKDRLWLSKQNLVTFVVYIKTLKNIVYDWNILMSCFILRIILHVLHL